jgi:diguanylate cyclase (GGDEF)-like protein/hemerythrin-like metal-binding protein
MVVERPPMDSQTLLIAVILLLFTFSGVFFAVGRQRNQHVLSIYSTAYFITGIAYILAFFQSNTVVGLVVGVLFFNLFTGFGVMLMATGMQAFRQEKMIYKRHIIAYALFALSSIIFVLIIPSFSFRVAGISFYTAFMMTEVARYLLTHKDMVPKGLRNLFFGAVSLTTILAIFRALYTFITVPPTVIVHQDSLSFVAASMYSIVSFSLWAALVLILNQSLLTNELKQKNDLLEASAKYDFLTGLFNRNTLERELDDVLKELQEKHIPTTLILVDIDYFKSINDSYGHQVGDLVLKDLSKILVLSTGTVGKVYRWGGEEFLIVTNQNLTEAISLAEQIRVMVMQTVFPIQEQVTISCGVADYELGESKRVWFQNVDFALYHAKYSGRNQVKAHSRSLATAGVYHRLEWQEKWNSGNHEIDVEHKKLVDYANMLLDINPLETPQVYLEEIILKIYLELKSHFDHEELILQSIGYTDYMEHRTIHRNLLVEMEQIMTKVKEGSINSIHLFNTIVGKILIGHMLQEDTKFFGLTND